MIAGGTSAAPCARATCRFGSQGPISPPPFPGFINESGKREAMSGGHQGAVEGESLVEMPDDERIGICLRSNLFKEANRWHRREGSCQEAEGDGRRAALAGKAMQHELGADGEGRSPCKNLADVFGRRGVRMALVCRVNEAQMQCCERGTDCSRRGSPPGSRMESWCVAPSVA